MNSVLFPFYNTEKYIAEALESLLKQTFKDFYIIAVDDFSTDNSSKIVEEYSKKDSRIKLYKNKYEKGLVGARNTTLDYAEGKYLFLMDSDDVCSLDRFQKEYDYMESNPDVIACGTWGERIGQIQDKLEYLIEEDEIKAYLIFAIPLLNASSIYRHSIIKENNLRYDSFFKMAEDFDFLARLSDFGKLAVIPEYLYKYRIHGTNTVIKERFNEIHYHQEVVKRTLKRFGIDLTTEESLYMENLRRNRLANDLEGQKWMKNLFTRIVKFNDERHVYKAQALTKIFELVFNKLMKPTIIK